MCSHAACASPNYKKDNHLKKNRTSFIRNVAAISFVGFAGVCTYANNFDAIVASLLGNDVQLELMQRQVDAASASLDASNVLSDPEAEVEYLRSGSGEQKFNLSVSQSFDWPGVYIARNRQIELERSGLRLACEAERNAQRMKLRTLLVDIIAANRVIAQMSETVEWCDKLLETLEADYKRGDVSVLEVNKMRIELADFKLKLSEAKTGKDALLGELVSMSDNADEIIARCDGLDNFPIIGLKSLEQYIEEAKAAAPSLQEARNKVVMAKSRKEVASRSTLPGFSAGYRLSREDGMLFNGFMVGVSVPLWRASKERRAAASEEISAMFGEKAEEIKLEKSIDATYRKAVSLKETLEQYGTALTASDNVGLLRRAYESGAITLTEFVLEVNYFVEAGVQYTELQRRYYNALVELSRYDDYTEQ